MYTAYIATPNELFDNLSVSVMINGMLSDRWINKAYIVFTRVLFPPTTRTLNKGANTSILSSFQLLLIKV